MTKPRPVLVPSDGPPILPMALARAVIRLAGDHVRHAPPRDWGPGQTVHDAMADAAEELLDRLDDPAIIDRLNRMALQEMEAYR